MNGQQFSQRERSLFIKLKIKKIIILKATIEDSHQQSKISLSHS